MHRAVLVMILLAAIVSMGLLWLTGVPLGIPGEWTWDRVTVEPDSAWNLFGAAVAAGLYLLAVRAGWNRLGRAWCHSIRRLELGAWLIALVAMSFAWIWIVQEAAPQKNRLGKTAFVLYYASSSGYFTKARYEDPKALELLARYEELMRERDVLHVGTHPPGLFLAFQGLIVVCEMSPALSSFLDITQPSSFREACDVIATNAARGNPSRPLLPLDRRVLWLATLLVLASASLVVLPLYSVVAATHGSQTAWLTAAFWPAVPAAAVFVPKSDVLYAFIGMLIVGLWLNAIKKRSMAFGLLAGLCAWCGLLCSLAFLPVILFAMLASWRSGSVGIKIHPTAGAVAPTTSAVDVKSTDNEATLIKRASSPPNLRWPVLAAVVGFVIPTLILGWLARVNLPVVWWLNYQNHAGFYQQYSRTYWKWLLINPLELGFAVGWPVMVMALAMVVPLWGRRRMPFEMHVSAMLVVLGVLWVTGKNSGEAARLWIVFLPWLVWLAGPWLASVEVNSQVRWLRPAWAVLALQLAVSLLTVARVSGFHFEP